MCYYVYIASIDNYIILDPFRYICILLGLIARLYYITLIIVA